MPVHLKNAMSVVTMLKKILPPCNGMHTEHMLALEKSILVPSFKIINSCNCLKKDEKPNIHLKQNLAYSKNLVLDSD